MAIERSTNNRFSRYLQGGDTDIYPNRLGWWERRPIPTALDDIRVEVQPEEEGRPDLMAFRIYGNAKLAWIILQTNTIVDIEEEFTLGKTFNVPSSSRVSLQILTSSPGGNVIEG